MLGIRQMKATPNTHVFQYRWGKLIQDGPGLSFLYFAPVTTIVSVPLGSVTVPFIFNELTDDFQTLTAQGQLTYRIADPKRASSLLDFTLKPDGTYLSEDPETLPERLIGVAQMIARQIVERYTLQNALASSAEIGRQIFEQ